MTDRQSLGILSISFATSAVLLFWYLSLIPGLHGDEAWVGLRAHSILQGARPLIGMNTNTGPIHQYLVALPLAALGYKIAVLRSVTAIASLVTIVLYYHIVRRLFQPMIAALATLLLVTMPFFTLFGRLAGENFALNPVLAAASILLVLRGAERWGMPAQQAYCFVAGLLLGLGAWNHAIFLSVPFALAAVTLYKQGLAMLRAAATYVVVTGFVVALVPRALAQLWLEQDHPRGFAEGAAGGISEPVGLIAPLSNFIAGVLRRARSWPPLFLQVAHGDVLFRRFAGEVPFPSPNLVALLVLVGLIAMIARHARRPVTKSPQMQVMLFVTALFVSTLVGSPKTTDRYFLLPLYVLPIFMAEAVFALIGLFEGLKGLKGKLSRSMSWERIGLVAVGLFACFQVSRTSVNYFLAQARSHGRPSSFELGDAVETSNHFIRTDALYQELADAGARHVWAEFFIAEPLQFYDLVLGRSSSIQVNEMPMSAGEPRTPVTSTSEGKFVVFYASGLRRNTPADYPEFTCIFQDSQFVVAKAAATSRLP